jgi:hypothetical protein
MVAPSDRRERYRTLSRHYCLGWGGDPAAMELREPESKPNVWHPTEHGYYLVAGDIVTQLQAKGTMR